MLTTITLTVFVLTTSGSESSRYPHANLKDECNPSVEVSGKTQNNELSEEFENDN